MTDDKRKGLKVRAGCLTQNGQINIFLQEYPKILCLVCRKVVSVPNEYNLRLHFETNHRNLAELDANEKSLKAKTLQLIFALNRNFLSFMAVKVLLVQELARNFKKNCH